MPKTCDTPFRCRETPHSDVLNQNTAPATKKVQVRGSVRTYRTGPSIFMWAECGQTTAAVLGGGGSRRIDRRLDWRRVRSTTELEATPSQQPLAQAATPGPSLSPTAVRCAGPSRSGLGRSTTPRPRLAVASGGSMRPLSRYQDDQTRDAQARCDQPRASAPERHGQPQDQGRPHQSTDEPEDQLSDIHDGHDRGVRAAPHHRARGRDMQRPGADTRVLWGCFLDLINAGACIGTAVTLFPVVKRQHERAALGFMTARVIEAAIIIVGVVSLLLGRDLAAGPGRKGRHGRQISGRYRAGPRG
jgi:hypothetical protein